MNLPSRVPCRFAGHPGTGRFIIKIIYMRRFIIIVFLVGISVAWYGNAALEKLAHKNAIVSTALSTEEKEALDWDIFVESVAWAASRQNADSIATDGRRGYLMADQRHVDLANEALGTDFYCTEDLMSKEASKAMFFTVQNALNPMHDKVTACRIWFGDNADDMTAAVMTKYHSIRGTL